MGGRREGEKISSQNLILRREEKGPEDQENKMKYATAGVEVGETLNSGITRTSICPAPRCLSIVVTSFTVGSY